MAKLKANETGLWVISGGSKDGVQVQGVLHDARWLEVIIYDFDAPRDRRFTVVFVDRSTGESFGACHQFKGNAMQEAMQAAGMRSSYQSAAQASA